MLSGALPCGVRTFLPPSREARRRAVVWLAANFYLNAGAGGAGRAGGGRRAGGGGRGGGGEAGGGGAQPFQPYPSVSCEIWYCSSFLYRLLRGVSITSAVFDMFQPFSRSFDTRYARSLLSLNSRNVPARLASPSPAVPAFREAPAPLRTISGRSEASIVSPAVMIISRSTVLLSSRMFPFHRYRCMVSNAPCEMRFGRTLFSRAK